MGRLFKLSTSQNHAVAIFMAVVYASSLGNCAEARFDRPEAVPAACVPDPKNDTADMKKNCGALDQLIAQSKAPPFLLQPHAECFAAVEEHMSGLSQRLKENCLEVLRLNTKQMMENCVNKIPGAIIPGNEPTGAGSQTAAEAAIISNAAAGESAQNNRFNAVGKYLLEPLHKAIATTKAIDDELSLIDGNARANWQTGEYQKTRESCPSRVANSAVAASLPYKLLQSDQKERDWDIYLRKFALIITERAGLSLGESQQEQSNLQVSAASFDRSAAAVAESKKNLGAIDSTHLNNGDAAAIGIAGLLGVGAIGGIIAVVSSSKKKSSPPDAAAPPATASATTTTTSSSTSTTTTTSSSTSTLTTTSTNTSTSSATTSSTATSTTSAPPTGRPPTSTSTSITTITPTSTSTATLVPVRL